MKMAQLQRGFCLLTSNEHPLFRGTEGLPHGDSREPSVRKRGSRKRDCNGKREAGW